MIRDVETRSPPSDNYRWLQLIGAVACMVMIANLQYGWTLFVNPINKAHGWSLASIQVGFSIFIALETWLTPVDGWLADKFGPKPVIAAGGILVAIGWVLNSHATTLPMLYFGEALSGIGAGAVYATCVGLAVKWFPDRRGLAVGLTAAGYGAGSAISVIPIERVIASGGYEAAFFWFGIVQGGIVFLIAWALRAPEPGEIVVTAAVEGGADGSQLHAGTGVALAGLLASVPHVRHGFGKRPHGDRADQADRG